MLTKRIKYTDYDGNVREEDFRFNLNKAELAEMEFSTEGGLEKTIKLITDTQDTKKLIELFKGLILKAYGVKSPDGKRFVKSQELRDEFSQTEAYSELFMELATNDKAASDFIKGVLPTIEGVDLKQLPTA